MTAKVLARVRSICLSLPDTVETMTWGKPHFRVGDKIFAGCGDEDGVVTLGCTLEMQHAALIVSDARFERAPYVGHKGWVSMKLEGDIEWPLVEELVHESYGLIAPKKSLAKLGSAGEVRQDRAKSKKAKTAKKPKKAKTAKKAARKTRT